MKKAFRVKAIQRIAGIIAIVATAGFLLAASGDGGSANVVGTWTGTWTEKVSGLNMTTSLTYVFKSDGSFTATTNTMGIPMSASGTYTVSGNTVRVTNSSSGETGTATVSGNTMTVDVKRYDSTIDTVKLTKK
jgi:hypothetical protein